MFETPMAVLTVLVGVAALFFYLEQKTEWKGFNYFPPLLFIYATPVVLNNVGFIPSDSPVYGGLGDYALPVFIALMLFNVNVPSAVRIMGKGVLVMLLGTVGIVVGGVVSYAIVHAGLDPMAWKGYGALAGSWIGGTGNMAGVAGALETPPEMLGLAVLADNLVYVIWLPILLGSKAFADRFNRWAKVPEERIERMETAAAQEARKEVVPRMQDYLYLLFWALLVASAAKLIAPLLPEIGEVLTTSTWTVLLVTTFALALSATPVRGVPGSHALAMAIIYVFVAGMGARASLAGFDQAPLFVLGAYIWIFIHGGFCLFGAWLFRVDVHSAAIASAANVGGAASAPVVAAYHREALVPVAILMALIGYALGNYLAILTAQLCQWVG
ncbi:MULTISPECIES: DUF819 domain-containing protein [unclassified Wenzhouxiangella]|uniref:DUF819 family protein n=1 Tax=unclassified Wenzhouxiangella TaxID=2613841 RepID=UPI000E32839A|nr:MULTISPECIES: DUF819 family protein [unclassified Wenzhouxiangella]RFF29175.1 DUF819 family protein [Wenzhouxiangella sp. 15181]RFP68000.1 DUF819 family protein [Wenzhouxiangella sp. 15190]